MGIFSKKVKEEFNATKSFMVDMLQYDEERKLIKIKNVKNLIPVESIQLYQLKFGNKVYTKTNLGRAIVGGVAFGWIGVVMAGTHKEEYISNIQITIKADDKFYFIPLTIGKVKASAAEAILHKADDMISFLDEITE
jgi:hypothetical protein